MNEGDDLTKCGHRTLAFLGRLSGRARRVMRRAHMLCWRLSTLRNFDRIVVLQNGNIVQEGPERLLRADGPYRTLVVKEVKRLSRRAA